VRSPRARLPRRLAFPVSSPCHSPVIDVPQPLLLRMGLPGSFHVKLPPTTLALPGPVAPPAVLHWSPTFACAPVHAPLPRPPQKPHEEPLRLLRSLRGSLGSLQQLSCHHSQPGTASQVLRRPGAIHPGPMRGRIPWTRPAIPRRLGKPSPRSSSCRQGAPPLSLTRGQPDHCCSRIDLTAPGAENLHLLHRQPA